MERVERDPARIEPTLKRIEKIWKSVPQLRLGQLFGNCVNMQQLYYYEDDMLLAIMEKMYQKYIKETTKKLPDNKGRVYIHKGTEVKSVFKQDLPKFLEENWKLGRKD